MPQNEFKEDVFHLPVHAVRTVSSPSVPRVKSVFAWVNLKDLPEGIPTKVNPRDTNMRTNQARKLMASVKSPDAHFDLLNRGMTIVAKEANYNQGAKRLNINLGTSEEQESKYGLLDGGHTYKAILAERDNIPDGVEKYVRVEVIVGDDVDVQAVSDGRNTSVQVSDIALYNLSNRFGFIEEAIAGLPWANRVAYKDNEVKEGKAVGVIELIRLMYAFNLELDNGAWAPTNTYSGNANVFKDYKRAWAETSGEESDQPSDKNIYVKLAAFLPDFVDLYEQIQREIGAKYAEAKKKAGEGQKFGAIRGVTSRNGKGQERPSTQQKFTTFFTERPMDYDVSRGYIVPIFAAFRAMLEADQDGNLAWKLGIKPSEVWDRVGADLVMNVFGFATDPGTVGKSRNVYQSSYRIVKDYINDMELEMLRAQLAKKNG